MTDGPALSEVEFTCPSCGVRRGLPLEIYQDLIRELECWDERFDSAKFVLANLLILLEETPPISPLPLRRVQRQGRWWWTFDYEQTSLIPPRDPTLGSF